MSILGEKWAGLIYPILVQFVDAYTIKDLKCLTFVAASGSTLLMTNAQSQSKVRP